MSNPRNWLTQLRLEKNLLQKDVATRVGASKAVVAQWESGTRRPGYEKMLALADLLGRDAVLQGFESEAKAAEAEAKAKSEVA